MDALGIAAWVALWLASWLAAVWLLGLFLGGSDPASTLSAHRPATAADEAGRADGEAGPSDNGVPPRPVLIHRDA